MRPFSDAELKFLIGELDALAKEYGSCGQADVISRAAHSFRSYLTKQKPSLDHAFGRIEAAGKRITPERFALACKAYQLRFREDEQRSWAQVEAELDAVNLYDLDAAGLKTLVHRHKGDIHLHFFGVDLAAAMSDE